MDEYGICQDIEYFYSECVLLKEYAYTFYTSTVLYEMIKFSFEQTILKYLK